MGWNYQPQLVQDFSHQRYFGISHIGISHCQVKQPKQRYLAFKECPFLGCWLWPNFKGFLWLPTRTSKKRSLLNYHLYIMFSSFFFVPLGHVSWILDDPCCYQLRHWSRVAHAWRDFLRAVQWEIPTSLPAGRVEKRCETETEDAKPIWIQEEVEHLCWIHVEFLVFVVGIFGSIFSKLFCFGGYSYLYLGPAPTENRISIHYFILDLCFRTRVPLLRLPEISRTCWVCPRRFLSRNGGVVGARWADGTGEPL